MGAPLPKIGESLRLFARFYEIGRPSQAVWNFLCIPFPETAERLRLFAFCVIPMINLADSLRLCALHSRKVRNVSGFLHRHAENGRHSQAVCIFWALHSRKLGKVSGCLHGFMKLADRLRLFGIFCAFHSRKLRNVSGYLHFVSSP